MLYLLLRLGRGLLLLLDRVGNTKLQVDHLLLLRLLALLLLLRGRHCLLDNSSRLEDGGRGSRWSPHRHTHILTVTCSGQGGADLRQNLLVGGALGNLDLDVVAGSELPSSRCAPHLINGHVGRPLPLGGSGDHLYGLLTPPRPSTDRDHPGLNCLAPRLDHVGEDLLTLDDLALTPGQSRALHNLLELLHGDGGGQPLVAAGHNELGGHPLAPGGQRHPLTLEAALLLQQLELLLDLQLLQLLRASFDSCSSTSGHSLELASG